MWTPPSIAEFKAFFARDFNYAPSTDPNNLDYIIDGDITKAINEGVINFNTSLYGTDAQVTNVFMYLAAFFLVFNIQNSMKGITSQSRFPISSNSVGGVSISFQLPERYAKDPILSMYTQNGYGMKYLALSLPFLSGNVNLIEGTTTFD